MKTNICAVIVGPSLERADHQINQAKKCANFVELRLDYFDTLDLSGLKRLRQSHADIPMIFTLRERSQGGLYQGTEEQRLADIERLAQLKPEYFDLEHNIPTPLIDLFIREHPDTKLILSFHDFETTPHQLQWISKLMHYVPAAIYKVAAVANCSTDVVRMLRFLQDHQGNLIISTMGELGRCGRILGPVFGNFLTYSSIDSNQKTAPGQIPINEMNSVYRFDTLSEASDAYALIGDPVDKSPSHTTHNKVFQALGVDAVYVKLPVTQIELEDFCHHALKLGVKGFSVTMPLKEAIIPYLTQVDEEAQKIGAVNTVINRGTFFYGCNTDGIGALDALEEKKKVKGERIVVLGAGGAIKALVYEAIKRGAHPIVLNRTERKAQALAQQFGCEAASLAGIERVAKEGYAFLVNGTPNAMPISAEHILPSAVVMDMTITPKETLFLITASEKGCQIVYGKEMFLHQAIGQFRLWFPNKYDPETIRKIIRKTF